MKPSDKHTTLEEEHEIHYTIHWPYEYNGKKHTGEVSFYSGDKHTEAAAKALAALIEKGLGHGDHN